MWKKSIYKKIKLLYCGQSFYQITTLIVLLGFMSILFYLVYKSRVSSDSLEVYAVGNKSFSSLSVALSLAASITSAATFIINPGFIALYGLSAFIAFGVVLTCKPNKTKWT